MQGYRWEDVLHPSETIELWKKLCPGELWEADTGRERQPVDDAA